MRAVTCERRRNKRPGKKKGQGNVALTLFLNLDTDSLHYRVAISSLSSFAVHHRSGYCEMNGDCENCAFWRNHYYWEHMGDEKKQFSAVAKGDFKNSIVSLPFRTLSVKFFCKFISTTVASRSASSPLFCLSIMLYRGFWWGVATNISGFMRL